ncbi:hypothetical protein [Hymenobacter sp. AT01-02]|uniref:hypothetical protein n=1 Tax=Hymenobacter sp. AT01-02 TaxID=1571877 RepID=UPI000695B3B0|nr:hypothetical protein [Hymenobacter sp. AT01-02]
MNYLTLINQFWQLRREVPFSSVEADLYFYLLEISNGLQWKNPFQQSNALIGATLGVSEKTLIAARNRLKQHALIDFTPGVKRTPSTYRLLLLRSTSKNTLEKLQGIREECDSASGSESDSESDSVSSKNASDIIKRKPNQTKKKTTVSAPTSPVLVNCLMRDSPVASFAAFLLAWQALDDARFAGADLEYYHASLLDWSDSKGEKKKDWVATIRGSMRRDQREGRLVTPGTPQPRNGPGSKGSAGTVPPKNIHDTIHRQSGVRL